MDDYRVLMLAPTRRDREATADLLGRAGISAVCCEGARSAALELESSAGAVLMTDAAFTDPHIHSLLGALTRQPPWSDVPVILLSGSGIPAPNIDRLHASLRNVTLLERPTSSRTLVSSVQAALRARARQYQLRDQFDALRSSEAALGESERQFRTMANSIPQLAWMAQADGAVVWYNRRWYEYTGTTPEQMLGWGWQAVHDPEYLPAVLDRWRLSLETGALFEMEFPLRSAEGQFRMFLTRVFPLEDESGEVFQWIGTNTDMESTKQIEVQLRATEAALRNADRRKDLFLATLAHELRNPLAPIRTAAQVLADHRLPPAQMKWAQGVIQRQVAHMALLLDDLLDIARITQGKLVLKRSRVTLKEVIDSAVEAAGPVIDGKHHQLDVSLPAHTVTLEADPLRLSQVLSNLLTNAAKYTDPAGHIRLTASVRDEVLHLCVADDGIGIAADALSRIFEMFSQVDSESNRSDGGLGIGLSLVKGLVELHGGEIEARSGGPGHGSEFIVRLPLDADLADSAPLPEIEAPPVKRRARRVMIADDNKDAADSLGMLLDLAGHEVRVVYTGRSALEIAQTFRPDVAFIDIGMPDMTGYEVAQQLRREPWGSGPFLVALTGWGQDDDRRRAREAGFDRHLTKPVASDDVDGLIAAAPCDT